MTIGTIIKKLRRERDITQEQLADLLGITSRAVSQWECDRTSPDISQLPLLANIFEVSADVLLGIDVDSKEKNIDLILKESIAVSCKGEKDKSIEILQNGLHEYPDSFKLMELYTSELYLRYVANISESAEMRSHRGKEAARYLDKILEGCIDNSIRNKAIPNACMVYMYIGRNDDAIKLAESAPEYYTRGELLYHIYTGTKKFEQLRDNVIGRFVNSIGDTASLAESEYDDGRPVYSEDDRLSIYQKTVDMFSIFFENCDYLYDAQYVEIAHKHIADIYANRLDVENTLIHLEQSVKFAVMFDTYNYEEAHTSLLAKGSVAGGVWWSDTCNRTYDLLSRLSDHKFDLVRTEPRFAAVENELKKYAKE